MKVVVSIPDHIIEAADLLAQQRAISRSELYTEALVQLLDSDVSHSITERLDEVYGDRSSELDPRLATMQTLALDDDW